MRACSRSRPAFAHVGDRKFPVLLRLVEALHEALFLFLPRDVEEELQDDRALPGEVILKVREIAESLVPDALAHQRRMQLLLLQDVLVHAHNEHFLVVRSVENTGPSTLGQALGITPEKVVIEIRPRRLLERENLAALGIDPRHDVLDGAVRVYGLKHEQQRPAVLGVEHVLLFCEPLGAALQQVGRLALVQPQPTGIAGIEILQPKALAIL